MLHVKLRVVSIIVGHLEQCYINTLKASLHRLSIWESVVQFMAILEGLWVLWGKWRFEETCCHLIFY